MIGSAEDRPQTDHQGSAARRCVQRQKEAAMAINLVSLISQFVTPDMIGRMASAMGLDANVAKKAVGGSIPALLAALAGVASKPGGAQQLSNAVAQQPPSVIDNLMSAIGGSGQKAVVDNGSSLLSTLVGGGAMNAIAGAIGKFAGVSEGTSRSLLGMLGPVVLGALGQQQRSSGLDASGLASLLTSQKDQIAAAIPSGLASQLSGAGLLDSLDGGMRRSAAAAGAAADRFGAATDRTVADASQAARAMGSQSSMQWPYWLLALAVLGGLGWYFFGDHGDRRVAEQNVPMSTSRPPETVGLGTPSLNAGGVDLGRQVSSSVGALTSALAGITDVTSAQAALPKIRDAKLQLDRVSALSSQLSPDGKRTLASLVAASMPALNRLCAKILSMPEVGNLAKPTIDELRTRLDSLVTA
jgi:hypothetical protein